MALIHEGCGHETQQGETCSSCGAPLVPESMTWVKPWKGARDRLVGVGVLTGPDGV
jgi:methionyl-tRNA synthetase